MPTIRKMYTLLDVKELIAKKEHCDPEEVFVSDHDKLLFDCNGNNAEVEDDSFLFQVDL